ncbi:hypothetical protein V8E36_005168 [Tilletia maclaganii]
MRSKPFLRRIFFIRNASLPAMLRPKPGPLPSDYLFFPLTATPPRQRLAPHPSHLFPYCGVQPSAPAPGATSICHYRHSLTSHPHLPRGTDIPAPTASHPLPAYATSFPPPQQITTPQPQPTLTRPMWRSLFPSRVTDIHSPRSGTFDFRTTATLRHTVTSARTRQHSSYRYGPRNLCGVWQVRDHLGIAVVPAPVHNIVRILGRVLTSG